jgi:hypothetical protein
MNLNAGFFQKFGDDIACTEFFKPKFWMGMKILAKLCQEGKVAL